MKPDLTLLLVDGSNISLLYPKTQQSQDWIEKNLGVDYQVFAKGIVVEHRYIDPILQGLRESDLSYLNQRS